MPVIRACLDLLRPANVVTALADVLAGCAIAGPSSRAVLPTLLASTACLYAGGVVLNDYFDREIDRMERPERPIPSGRVTAAAAATLGGALLAVGVLFALRGTAATAVVALALAGCILVYDAWGKRHARIGPINMAMCRALNLLLGVAAIPAALWTAWPLALLPLSYIYAVTAVSRGEVHGGARAVAGGALAILALVVASLGTIAARATPPSIAGIAVSLALGVVVLPRFGRAYMSPDPDTIRRAVRAGVLALVLLDAVLGGVYAGVTWMAAILATGVAAAALARMFSVT